MRFINEKPKKNNELHVGKQAIMSLIKKYKIEKAYNLKISNDYIVIRKLKKYKKRYMDVPEIFLERFICKNGDNYYRIEFNCIQIDEPMCASYFTVMHNLLRSILFFGSNEHKYYYNLLLKNRKKIDMFSNKCYGEFNNEYNNLVFNETASRYFYSIYNNISSK